MTFGERLKELRKTLNWTQEQMAMKLDMSQSMYGKIENNQREPNLETLGRLSNLTSIDCLLKGTASGEETPKKTFGDRIRGIRQDQGMTQEQLSDGLELTAQVISNYERNYREPDFSTLIKIANLFNVTTDYLLGVTENKETIEDYLNRRRVASGETKKSL